MFYDEAADVSSARCERWVVLPLEGTGVKLCPGNPRSVARNDLEADSSSDCVYVVGDGDEWILFAAPDAQVDVNGTPLDHGIRVLADRDEIRADGGRTRCFFSTETRPAVEPYAGPESACMRCRLALEPGGPAVRCPVCRIWHHEDPEAGRACWTAFDGCANCRHPTAMDGGFRFCPEDL